MSLRDPIVFLHEINQIIKELPKMNRESNGLIFIPDISGFTKFINNTEIQHSQHIIEELIEVLLESNNLKLEVSEIEGDAVLFYRMGAAPPAQEIAAQIESMFTHFHTHLKIIERDRVCQCGACSTSSNLTLKFLVHYGEISISKIREHIQLLGPNVIIAHRLMKNNISAKEYVLLTKNYTDSLQEQNFDQFLQWSNIESGAMTYEHIGEVNFHYVILTKLKEKVPSLPALDEPQKYNNPITVTAQINAPINFIYAILIDLELRTEWTDGLKNIIFNENEIPRIGSKHICDLPTGTVELETIHNKLKEGEIEYAERATKDNIIVNATTYFMMTRIKDSTNLRIEFHYKRRPLIGWLLDGIIRRKIADNFTRSAKKLKHYCEHKFRV